MRSIIITGGAGFIGSHLVRHFVRKYSEYAIINYDALTYAGNLDNVADIADAPNYVFIKGDICDTELLRQTFRKYAIDGVIHLAAESHVDRSIADPTEFARANVIGTLNLLQIARESWAGNWTDKHFHHVSTDEVYGALPLDGGSFTEQNRYDPHSPYSASKAGSDHFVRAFYDTYGVPVTITNCSNNYGTHQYPEKLIPLFVRNIIERKPLPVYGKGENVRDWLYVEDHCRAIDMVFHEGRAGETYNVGGGTELTNIELVHKLVETTDRLLGNPVGTSEALITFVTDRAGHDLRYSIDSTKLRTELGWTPQMPFDEGLEKTIAWIIKQMRR